MLIRPITPIVQTDFITKLCVEVSAGQVPVFVEVIPVAGAAINECFPNVDRKVQRDGGTMVLGWMIWESPGLFVEAEFHAIWQSEAGDLVDITPKSRPVDKILFLPQPDAVYSGRQVNNVRRAVSGDPEVAAYLRTYDAMFEFLNRGARAEQHGVLSLGGKDVLEYKVLADTLEMYEARLARRYSQYNPYLPCWCGSGKKGKWCHKSAQSNNIG
jgi:hypothetical protein